MEDLEERRPRRDGTSFTREEYEIELGGRRTSGITIRYLFAEWAVGSYTPAEFLASRQCQGEAGWLAVSAKRISRVFRFKKIQRIEISADGRLVRI